MTDQRQDDPAKQADPAKQQLPHRHRRGGRDVDDPLHWHGHRIVTEEDLAATFAGDEVEKSSVYMWRRIRHGIVLLLLVALIVAGVFMAVAISRGDLKVPGFEPEAAPPPPTCPAGVQNYAPNNTVTVNVYNGTLEEGLASQVGLELQLRGYILGETGNKDISQPGLSAVIVSGRSGEAGAFNLQRNIPNTEYVADARSDASVDIILGSGYEGLIEPGLVDQTPAALSCPRLSPTPVPPSGGPAPAETGPVEPAPAVPDPGDL